MDSVTLDKANNLKEQIKQHQDYLERIIRSDEVIKERVDEIPLGIIQFHGEIRTIRLDNQIGKMLYKMIEQAIRTKKQALEEELDAL